jgi:hypothetical protein
VARSASIAAASLYANGSDPTAPTRAADAASFTVPIPAIGATIIFTLIELKNSYRIFRFQSIGNEQLHEEIDVI